MRAQGTPSRHRGKGTEMIARTRQVALAVSAYDRAAAWVVAWNLLVGLSVGLLFLFWLSRYQVVDFPMGKKVNLVPGRYLLNDDAVPFMEIPTGDELEEAAAPAEIELINAVTDVVTSQAAALDVMPAVDHSDRVGPGDGDGRLPGGSEATVDLIPPTERWRIRYSTNSLATYRQQLDYFGIELGVVGGGVSHVDYASNLTLSRPGARRGPGGDEQRLYMLWTNGALRRFDERLLRAAGIETAGRIVLQFYPQDVEDELERVELAYARGQGYASAAKIAETTFGVRNTAGGFEYFVISQQYR